MLKYYMVGNMQIESTGYNIDPYESRVNDVRFGIYTQSGELVCKVTNKMEANLTRAELRKIDLEETGKKNKYFIRKL